ncbi:MAG: site-2 protease family protein [Gammaproteobacteria bacterium]|nr:site-2 protease family protein [Pseudomonadales bacterium]MCP5349311.1 site-2 protease family protein [Pseudomonadales bacterium]
MLPLLLSGQYLVFFTILVAIIFSLTLHEFGHASCAWLLGDDTAQKMGRLTLNPVSHIDPMGLLMVVLVGFGYARPVPTSQRKLRYPWGSAAVAAAGPLMNLLLAVAAINTLQYLYRNSSGVSDQEAMFLSFMAQINLLLMLFNLIPFGPLDGHYILSWSLPDTLRQRFDYYNGRYGAQLFLILILLSLFGVPIFNFLMRFSRLLMPYLVFVR